MTCYIITARLPEQLIRASFKYCKNTSVCSLLARDNFRRIIAAKLGENSPNKTEPNRTKPNELRHQKGNNNLSGEPHKKNKKQQQLYFESGFFGNQPASYKFRDTRHHIYCAQQESSLTQSSVVLRHVKSSPAVCYCSSARCCTSPKVKQLSPYSYTISARHLFLVSYSFNNN